jgi:hypothetical protein
MAPAHFDVHVTVPEDPLDYAWSGGSRLACSEKVCPKLRTLMEDGVEAGGCFSHDDDDDPGLLLLTMMRHDWAGLSLAGLRPASLHQGTVRGVGGARI